MVRKTVGYTRTEWTCPNCQTRNPGPQKTCVSCGMPQPEDVQFEQAAQEELIAGEAELEQAKAGADVHCYYCGSRNPASATTCSQCGADLSQATARTRGRTLGAHRHGPAPKITCAACGAENEANAPKCVQCGASLTQPEPEPAAKPEPRSAKPAPKKRTGLFGGIALGVIVVLLCIAGIFFVVLSRRTEDINGTVQDVSWTRTIAIEALQPVEYEDWQSDIPVDAVVGRCVQKVHHTQDNPAPNAKEVCGTPYSVDTGSGYAEVVQDCQYEVYQEWCQYTSEEWRQIDAVSISGRDFNPQWPSLSALGPNQRTGGQTEGYRVVFTTDEGQYTYQPRSKAEFDQFDLGSRWLLKVNTFNSVVDIERSE